MNTDHWESWQRDYLRGLILILPPDEVSGPIDALRQRYDPRSAASCGAHISLSDPLNVEMSEARAEEVCRILRRIEPFTLRYGKPRASPLRAGVSCPVTPQEPVDALKAALHTASVYASEPYGRRDIPAHMTIAEFISIERSLELGAQLHGNGPSGTFLCDRLTHVVPDVDFCFQSVRTFFLGRGPDPA